MHFCKMKTRQLYLLLMLALAVACNSRHEATAKIFERKEEAGNKLMIKYRYEAQGKQYVDSATIENRPLKGDTITVNFENSAPEKAIPQLGK